MRRRGGKEEKRRAEKIISDPSFASRLPALAELENEETRLTELWLTAHR
jgi:hypothetical protein